MPEPKRKSYITPKAGPPKVFAQCMVKGGQYREAIESLAAGRTPAEVAKDLGIRKWVVERIQTAAAKRIEQMMGDNWAATMVLKAKVAVDHGLEDPEYYNPAKIGVATLKGLGIFRADNQTPSNLIVDQRVINIIQNINQYSEREKQEILDLNRKALTEGTEDSRTGDRDAEPESQDREELPVVGAPLHQDV